MKFRDIQEVRTGEAQGWRDGGDETNKGRMAIHKLRIKGAEIQKLKVLPHSTAAGKITKQTRQSNTTLP